MTNEDKLIIQLRDCFTAGYTMPQFCIDNDIKKPLIVGRNEYRISFLWELNVQFQYDGRISAEFAIIEGESTDINWKFYPRSVQTMKLKNVVDLNVESYDKIIILAVGNESNPNVIYLQDLLDCFFKRAYVEIPILNFIQRNPGVKIIQINQPFLSKNENNSEIEKNFGTGKIFCRFHSR